MERVYRAASQAAGHTGSAPAPRNPQGEGKGPSNRYDRAGRMPRNQEVIRQWKVLHALESSRHGATIDALADDLDVTTRTIRRDLAALQEAGFPALRRARRGWPRAVAARRPGAEGARDRVSRSRNCARSI